MKDDVKSAYPLGVLDLGLRLSRATSELIKLKKSTLSTVEFLAPQERNAIETAAAMINVLWTQVCAFCTMCLINCECKCVSSV